MIKFLRYIKIIVAIFFLCTKANSQDKFSAKFATEVGGYFNHGKDTIFYGIMNSWQTDSMLIQEISTSVNKNVNGQITRSVRVDRVIFIDYRKKVLFEYSNMSDTARLMGPHFLYDTFSLTTGYPFNIRDEDVKYGPRQARQLADTTIDSVRYKRYLERIDSLNGTLYFTFFADCESQPSISLYPYHARKFGCPVMMATSSDEVNIRKRPYMLRKRMLLRDYLTEDEERIFAAWRKYAEEHPVKPSPPKKKPKSGKRKNIPTNNI
ncbi:hypothetical protein LZZ85_22725 [Terrimonas sp. NA20]|uniref:DUF4468 domain-containing protein n=1 Tax=Terrimonas ginsenosidimutans TaxID=2908004 RepID=A0ABS9KXX7_9BACT|nr:hypothetical protein [Terrimonas ginsenosidimutans]MCG2617128.1 hypothetical protein [Terrimonas ginsenosidimutans]